MLCYVRYGYGMVWCGMIRYDMVYLLTVSMGS